MLTVLESSIKFAVLDMVLTLAFVNVKSIKYLLSQRILCVVAQLARHIPPSFILTSITHGFKIKLIQTINNINNNIIDVIKNMIFYLILI